MSNDEACHYVIAMIDRVKTTDSDHALANNLQTRMQLMAWTLNLFEPIEAVRLSNLRRTGLACVNKFLANARTGEYGWAQFDRGHNNLHTVMDRIVKKLDDDPRLRTHGSFERGYCKQGGE